MEHYICIHGHFYQPPRENPWIESVEIQESAHPYHDWNKRITSECYAPNARARILDRDGWIVQMVNNYTRMSFNFGPTLLSWLEINESRVYQAILEADHESRKLFSGHGSALAQAYNHIILPLANRRDKETQVLWGIRDFERRFGRRPEGMWLPETAVDMETLDILAGNGILFTILAQHQAYRIRARGDAQWKDVSGGKIDPAMPYTLRLPSGRTITLFFYHGAISKAVAFERLLNSGEAFVQRLLDAISTKDPRPQIVNIATDGESYGHHHQFGEMALAYALKAIEERGLARLTNYGEYLEKHAPTHEVEIMENTSWSCIHGVERWRDHCTCCTGSFPEWNQMWRKGLRQAFDWLTEKMTKPFEERGESLFIDPWEARNAYIDLILDRSASAREKFLTLHGRKKLNKGEQVVALKLMEIQRHVMRMYTSCGWFFDDLSGIETRQVMQYAGRALQLFKEVFGEDLEEALLDRLGRARSNIPAMGDGRSIYGQYVKPAMADLRKVGAHYAISSLFQEYEKRARIYCYQVEQEDYHLIRAGKAALVMGRARFVSETTTEEARLFFGVLHLGDHNFSCGVRSFEDEKDYESMMKNVSLAFGGADFPQTIRQLDRHFDGSTYSLKSLFRDEQGRILDLLLESTLREAEAAYRQIYENYAPMIRFLKDSGGTLHKSLYLAAEFVLNADLHRALKKERIDPVQVNDLLETAKMAGIALDSKGLEYALRTNLEGMAEKLASDPLAVSVLEGMESALEMLNNLPFQVNLWTVQNICYGILKTVYPEKSARANKGEESAMEWVTHFTAFCNKLWLKIN